VIGRTVELRQTAQFCGLVPFHDEKTPSFTVIPGKTVFHCFGCNPRWNVFNFIMETQHVTSRRLCTIDCGGAGYSRTSPIHRDNKGKKSGTVEEGSNATAARYYYVPSGRTQERQPGVILLRGKSRRNWSREVFPRLRQPGWDG